MLVLKRRRGEQIFITVPPSSVEQKIVLTQCSIDAPRGAASIGIEAPLNILISRDNAKISKNQFTVAKV